MKQFNKKQFDVNRKEVTFEVGDLVTRTIALNHPSVTKVSPKYSGPYVILKQITPLTYEIGLCEDESHENFTSVTTAHVSQLKKFLPKLFSPSLGECGNAPASRLLI